MRKLFVPLLVPLVVTYLLATAGQGSVSRHTLAPGVDLIQEVIPAPDGPLVINVLRIDVRRPGVRIESALARDVMLTDEPAKGREALGALATRRGALAAVNADFFPFTGMPIGVAIRDGELLREGLPHRAALGITSNGSILVDNLLSVGTLFGSGDSIAALDGINRPAKKNELVLITPSYGASIRASAGQTVIPLSEVALPVILNKEISAVARQALPAAPEPGLPRQEAALVADGAAADWARQYLPAGTKIRLRFDFVTNPLPPGPLRTDLPSRAGTVRGRLTTTVWNDVVQAIGGGPWLVRDGKIAVDGDQEGFSANGFVNQRHPRTAAGVSSDGILILATVDGRQATSRGMSLPELASLMLRLGAVQAINLDGGGSTSMTVNGLYVNSPSDGDPRPIANALLVFAGDAGAKSSETTEPIRIRAGDKFIARVPSPATDDTKQPVWGTVEGKAYVDPSGNVYSTHAGAGTVVADFGDRRIVFPYLVEPGPPAKVRASLGPVPNNPPDRNMLTVAVTDQFSNPLPGQAVMVKVSGGEAERTEVMTGRDGRVALEVVWNVEKGGQVSVSSPNLPPVIVSRKTSN